MTHEADATPAGGPTATVVIANYNGARYLPATLRSVLRQTLRDIEVIVSDDASTDDSVALAQEIAKSDSRVRVIASPSNLGPAAARNRALDTANGRWIAVVDADDLLHPRRLEWLIAAAESSGADIVADNAIAFDDARATPATSILNINDQTEPFAVTAEAYLQRNGLDEGATSLGYLKPIIRSSALGVERYDPRLIVAEDFDLILRLLLKKARFVVHPVPLYFYRRHSVSISHRLSVAKVRPMIEANSEIMARLRADGGMTPGLDQALARRAEALARSLDYERIIAALKQKEWLNALSLIATKPAAAAGLTAPLQSALARALSAKPKAPVATSALTYRLRRTASGPTVTGRSDPDPLDIVVPPVTDAGRLSPNAERRGWTDVFGPDLVAATREVLRLADTARQPARRIVCDSEDLREWSPFLLHPDTPVDVAGTASNPAG